jgi:hypothetical protein
MSASLDTHAVLRISAPPGASTQVTFDALLVVGQGPSRDNIRHLTGEQTPFELDVEDGDLCAVVFRREGPDRLVVEYVAFDGSEIRLYNRTESGGALVVRRGLDSFSAGLPVSDRSVPVPLARL